MNPERRWKVTFLDGTWRVVVGAATVRDRMFWVTHEPKHVNDKAVSVAFPLYSCRSFEDEGWER